MPPSKTQNRFQAMAYTVLARRYRSSTFDEVIGQDHVARTIKRAIATDRIAHAYLFCGTRGVGKTSMARILAKALNCEASDKPTPEPCGQCASCRSIARGEDIDVIEIDAASNTGVDNVRDLIENSQYRPARARFKVYIIDEVHMLSKAAFNALLKIMEEPPEHVKFILATTEPEKVLPTILSRCQRYDFRNIPTREIAGHLRAICEAEKIDADDDALLLVAKSGAGSMRDALSLLDRLLSIGEKKLNTELIEQLLGLPRSQLVFDLVQAMGHGEVKQVLSQADSMVTGGLSVDSLLSALSDHLRNLLVLRTCGPDPQLVEVPGLSMDELMKQAQRFEPVILTQDITILEELRRQLRQTQAGRALLDATLVRLTLAEQFTPMEELLSRVNGSASAASSPAEKKKPEPVTRAAPLNVEPPTSNVQLPASSDSTSDSTGVAIDVDLGEDDDLPRPGKVFEGPSLKELLQQQSSVATAPAKVLQVRPDGAGGSDAPFAPVNAGALPAPPDDIDSSNLLKVWQTVVNQLSGESPMMVSILAQGRLRAIEENQAVVTCPPQHETFVRRFERNGTREQLRDLLSQVVRRSIGIRFEIDTEQAPTAPVSPRLEEPRPSRAATQRVAEPDQSQAALAPTQTAPIRITPELIEQLRTDPLIAAAMDELGATILKVE
jgi:DNA polymerase III subunit gamma/tau